MIRKMIIRTVRGNVKGRWNHIRRGKWGNEVDKILGRENKMGVWWGLENMGKGTNIGGLEN